MSYEPVQPEEPDRQGELALIDDIEKSFVDQKFWKYYYPSADRINRIVRSELENDYQSRWRHNFKRGIS